MGSIREMTDFPLTQAWAASAALATGNFAGPIVPFKGSLVAVKFVPSAAIVANGTNFATMTVQNKGTNGLSGTTAMATRTWSANNSALSVADLFTLNATPANLVCNEGDVLQVALTSAGGSGLALPAGSIVYYFAYHA